MKIVIVVVALVCAAKGLSIPEYSDKAKSTCEIRLDPPTDTTPLVLMADGLEFRLPDGTNVIRLRNDEKINVVCPGDENAITIQPKQPKPNTKTTPPQQNAGTTPSQGNTLTTTPPQNPVSSILVQCKVDGKLHGVDGTSGKVYNFNNFKCKSNLVDVAKNNNCNAEKGTLLEIGYPVGHGLVKTIDICFDDKDKITLWSRHVLVAGITNKRQRLIPPIIDPSTGKPVPAKFKEDSYYSNIKPNDKYEIGAQWNTFKEILGSKTLASQYIGQQANNNLNRGHLSPRADFVYNSQQEATFHYINTAPQWRTFNGGNWEQVEQKLRDFANVRTRHLVVYTGTHDILTFKDSAKPPNNAEIWMRYVGAGDKAIPVPKLFWKVVYDEATKEAVAIVGVNNPYFTTAVPDDSYLLCKGNEVTVSWLVLADPTNKVEGYTYCCEVDAAFREQIKSLPGFPVRGLLDYDPTP